MVMSLFSVQYCDHDLLYQFLNALNVYSIDLILGQSNSVVGAMMRAEISELLINWL